MMTQEENDLLTQTDRGTPMGELMRRYWQPVALSEELPEGGAPIPVKIMGEELVLYRDEQGKAGIAGDPLSASGRGLELWASGRGRTAVHLSWLAIR